MFLIDRPASERSASAELFPQRFFAGSGDLVRAALQPRPTAATDSAAPSARRSASQLDLALPTPTRRRKAG